MKLTLQELEKHRDSLPFKLHDWQWADALKGMEHDRFALYLPVGAGKTAVATLIALAWNDPYIIVLLPPILITQWTKWLNSLPNAGGAIAFRGTPKQRYALPIEKFKWVVMSIDIFKIDFLRLQDHYAGEDVTIVVDEAQNLRSSYSKNFKKVQQFATGGKLLLATGTELNSPIDAYAYIKLKTPKVYRTLAHFENMHVAQRDFFDKPVLWEDLETVSKHLYTCATKRSKEEIHKHLPKANYVPILYDLEPAHLKLYSKLADEMILELPTGGKIDVTAASALYNALQQIIVNLDHFAGTEGSRPAIFDVIDQVCDEIQLGRPGSSKLIIWTWFKRTTELVRDYVNKKFERSTVAAYSGADSNKSVERFLNDSTCLVLVAQPGSAGMGLNPQHLCWEALFVEAPTRTIPFKQSSGRIDREGQRYNPTIRVATANDTLQVGMFRNLLSNDAEVMQIQNETGLRQAIYGG